MGNFLVPGIFLAIFLGVLPLVAFFGLIGKKESALFDRLNVYRDSTIGHGPIPYIPASCW